MDTVARGEAELDRLVERRSRKGETTPDETEALYMASVRRYNEERRLQARAEWHLYHTERAAGLRRTLQALVEYHEEQAAKLLEGDSA